MLTALEQGVKGEKWFRLNDKIFAERNLLAAFQQVGANRSSNVTSRSTATASVLGVVARTRYGGSTNNSGKVTCTSWMWT